MGPNNRELMSIGQLAEAAGVATTALRFYEREGILAPTSRSRAGYRLYDMQALKQLRFVRSAQAVGFTLDDVRTLLHVDGTTPCQEIQELIERRLTEVDAKLSDLEGVRAALVDALERCRNSKTTCAVLADLKTDGA